MPVMNLTYQSSDISFPDWVTLFTLCLAPLLAHLIAGAPQPSYLALKTPLRWHDRLCLYNPTSIMWRYAAITDRRIRARRWSPQAMAASSAIFWTDHGWNGLEHMVADSVRYRTRMPESSRLEMLSTEMLETIITTLQGIQFAWLFVGGTVNYSEFNRHMGLDGIFSPLACFGLLRLFAATWLTSDFTYIIPVVLTDPAINSDSSVPIASHPVTGSQAQIAHDSNYRTPSYWPSRIFRALYIFIILGYVGLATIYLIVTPALSSWTAILTATVFFVALFYFILAIMSFAIIGYYLLRGHTSTIIPCISHPLYKVYTIFLMIAMVALFVIAALETRKTACGKFTSLAPHHGKDDPCFFETPSLVTLS
ncbi:hypothetical protein BJ170DRAFT_717672 [Xylariales sp. AK1849]|nr:hypothetical protein BJ170DRAFT_717672 [Xylariales sp. AK1849]